jgi:hypothetical protein
LLVSYIANGHKSVGLHHGRRYNVVLRAMIESALVTWVGLLIYEISSLAPAGHVTVCGRNPDITPTHTPPDNLNKTNYDVGYVMLCIIPIFFVRVYHALSLFDLILELIPTKKLGYFTVPYHSPHWPCS